ncbi:hypothetical protein IMZ29_21700 [Achromobacter sp. GG226]|uniref:tetratricopeptide repeat protein n=1 Tax=Verticiella alkaliphila TaxID=2779529 RepID=UPI001C0E5CCA|nr:tetratricopeptide repeat protein [Verticiella sp. GG226]MBU4613062.1 hypothetical protein [Verticiella sp. GG226]
MAAFLAGCSTPETAFQLMREQQQLQRAAQDHDARQRTEAVAAEDVVYLSTIRRLQSEGRHFAALAHLDAYQNRFGDNAQTALLRADALRATGQRQASESAYQALLEGPEAAAAWHGLGLLAAAGNDLPRATAALARAAALAPTNVDILGDLGYARLRAGDRQGARVPLAQAAELAPDNLKAVANLAVLMAAEGNVDGAEAVMARAGITDAAREAVRRQAAQLAALPMTTTNTATAIAPAQAIAAASPARPPDAVVPVSPSRGQPAPSAETERPVVRALGAVATAPAPPGASAEAVPSGIAPVSAASPTLDLYAAPLPTLLDRIAAGGSTVQ